MSVLDIIFIAMFIVVFSYGFKRGFIASVLQLAGIVLGIILVARFGPLVQRGLMYWFNLGATPAAILAYILIFLLLLLIIRIIITLLQKITSFLGLRFIDRVLGGLFTVLNFFLILVLIFMVLSSVRVPVERLTNTSHVVMSVESFAHTVQNNLLGTGLYWNPPPKRGQEPL
ncbi:MAG: CvpA family protein [Candidatus Cloacimonetes bacterium]|nr:CvpA family protein [Candidatus Cloacimonadota bacterium]